MKKSKPLGISTDVLVIGGGLAGLNAAIAAAEKGAQVLVMDKGGIARSGSVGGGVDHFLPVRMRGNPGIPGKAISRIAQTWPGARGACRQDCPEEAITIVFPPQMLNV